MDRRITSQFGERRNYYKPGITHQGLDLAYAMNEPFGARAGGTVSFVGYDPNGYGNYLKVKDDSGREHIYAHANKVVKKVGDLVALNEVLGYAGATGRATGPHVHYGVYENGKAINPMAILNGNVEVAKPVLGKPNIKKLDSYDLKNSYAQALIQAQKRPSAPEMPTIDKELETIIRSNLISGLRPFEKPQFTTIEDIVNAEKGSKKEKIAEYLGTPEALGLVNGIISLISPKGRYGGSTGFAANMANEKQSAMDTLHNKIDASNEKRFDSSMDIFKELNLNDREKQKLVQQIKEFDVTSRIKQQELDEHRRHNMATEGLEGQKVEIENVKSSNKDRIPENVKKVLAENTANVSEIDDAIKALDENPKAYTWAKGIAGADIANRIDPKGLNARAKVDKVSALYRKFITGAQMSEKEMKYYERFLPAASDNNEIVKTKLKQMKSTMENYNKNMSEFYTGQSSLNKSETKQIGKYTVRVK